MASLRSIILSRRYYMNWKDDSPEAHAKYRGLFGYAFATLASSDVILVNAQAVWDDLVPPVEQRDQEAWERLANFPNIPCPKPPFSTMWIEGHYGAAEQRCGALVARKEVRHDLETILAHMELEQSICELIRHDNPATMVNVVLFHDFEGSAVFTAVIEYWLDADGKFLSSFRQVPYLSGVDDERRENQIRCVKLRQGWLLHTFARLNCHNVKLLPQRAGAPGPKQRKPHAPTVLWHEIVVEQIQSRTTRNQPPSGEKRELRFHRVRGHYADYTQGAGLFGKYKVRLWVDEHARGNPELGEVVAGYKVI